MSIAPARSRLPDPYAAARDRLADALASARAVLRDDEPAVLAQLLARLAAHDDERRAGEAPDEALARELAAFAGGGRHVRPALADLLGLAARSLAADGAPPADAPGAAAWRAALVTVAHLYGGGVRRLGRLPFVGDERRARLLAESRVTPRRRVGEGQELAEPGPALRELAVDPRLAAAVSRAFGFRVAPSYRAVYMDYAPGAHVEPHVDHRDYEVIVHVTLAHAPPDDGSRRAALVVLRVDEPPVRVELAPGEALALRGRGSIHARERPRRGERWATLAIGFHPVEQRR